MKKITNAIYFAMVMESVFCGEPMNPFTVDCSKLRNKIEVLNLVDANPRFVLDIFNLGEKVSVLSDSAFSNTILRLREDWSLQEDGSVTSDERWRESSIGPHCRPFYFQGLKKNLIDIINEVDKFQRVNIPEQKRILENLEREYQQREDEARLRRE